ncbi:MAG: hypothetical protein WBJ13_08400 [Sedimentibacter sp.]
MSRINYNDNVAGTTCRRKCYGDVGGETGLVRCDCVCVYECLLALLADALGENNHPCVGSVSPGGGINGTGRRNCQCVYECLYELLADALEENGNHHKCPR